MFLLIIVGDRMKFSTNIKRRLFLIAFTSFAASTVFSSCSSPQNNSVAWLTKIMRWV
ncbi:hypothetical protein [uncultured Nostoc sp.]|uniref:hypothetical protein n=1 Tax=uncultured Nostoc sp. TaxID=340711 RepID=UPI0035CC78CE